MKKVFVLSVVVLLSLTSCYEFSREHKFKDAENDGKSVLIEAQSI